MPAIRITKLRFLLLGNRDEHGQEIHDYEVAGMCGIPPHSLSKSARGLRPLTQKDLLALADYFQTDPRNVQGWVELEFPDTDQATG